MFKTSKQGKNCSAKCNQRLGRPVAVSSLLTGLFYALGHNPQRQGCQPAPQPGPDPRSLQPWLGAEKVAALGRGFGCCSSPLSLLVVEALGRQPGRRAAHVAALAVSLWRRRCDPPAKGQAAVKRTALGAGSCGTQELGLRRAQLGLQPRQLQEKERRFGKPPR